MPRMAALLSKGVTWVEGSDGMELGDELAVGILVRDEGVDLTLGCTEARAGFSKTAVGVGTVVKAALGVVVKSCDGSVSHMSPLSKVTCQFTASSIVSDS